MIKGQAICPYCGHHNNCSMSDKNRVVREVYLCDVDSGGCDKYFVLIKELKIETETKKIDGESDENN